MSSSTRPAWPFPYRVRRSTKWSVAYPVWRSARSWLACEVRHLLRWDEDVPDGAASHVLVIGEVVDAGESEAGPPGESGGEEAGILRMEDTLMNYGG